MMEWWFKEDDLPLFNSCQEEFYNNPTFHFLSEPQTLRAGGPELNIPVFQYSITPIVSEAN